MKLSEESFHPDSDKLSSDDSPQEMLLYVRHPIHKHHQNQISLLSQLPEKDQEKYAQLLRFYNASYQYQHHLKSEPTEEDYKEWLTGLSGPLADRVRKKGYLACIRATSLRHYCLEKMGIPKTEFIEKLLNPEDLRVWQSQQDVFS